MIPDARFGLSAAEPGLELLHPAPGFTGPRDPVNDQSLVARITYGAHRFLFPGDVEAAGEAALAALARAGLDLRADVLKAPHHGSRTSSSPEFIRLVQPSFVVISCGLDNRYRHPSPQVLARYAGAGGVGSAAEVLRTDRRGTVVVESDGARLTVRYEGVPWLDGL